MATPAESSRCLEQAIAHLVSSRSSDSASDDISEVLALLEPSSNEQLLGTFAGYEVLDVAGRGGMGVVLKARDPKLDRIVAIKLMTTHNSAAHHDRFLREARAAAFTRS